MYEPSHISTELLHHMMSIIYHRSVLDPAKLNQYKAHTAEVYGEFTSSMVTEIVQKVPVKATDRFIDLGSGVGQIVLQVAAEAMCKLLGLDVWPSASARSWCPVECVR